MRAPEERPFWAYEMFKLILKGAVEAAGNEFKGEKLGFPVMIRIAHSLEFFDSETLRGLGAVYAIRNKFAHELDATDFENDKIAKLCDALTLATGPTPTDLRERYLAYLYEVGVKVKRKQEDLR